MPDCERAIDGDNTFNILSSNLSYILGIRFFSSALAPSTVISDLYVSFFL